MNKALWTNYGDVNPMEHGGTWVMSDEEKNGKAFKGCYYIVKFDPDTMEVVNCWVEVKDDWINRKSVMDYVGMTEDNYDEIRYAIACFEYYGYHEFQGESVMTETIEEATKILEDKEIILD